MIDQATAYGLSVNAAMRNHLVRGSPRARRGTMSVKPDPTAEAHDSLTWGWRRFEWLPNSAKWREWEGRESAGFYLPRGEPGVNENAESKPLIH